MLGVLVLKIRIPQSALHPRFLDALARRNPSSCLKCENWAGGGWCDLSTVRKTWVRCRERHTRCGLRSQEWKCGPGALWALRLLPGVPTTLSHSAPRLASVTVTASERASDSLTSWKGCRSGRWLSPAGVLSGWGWGRLRKSSWSIAPLASPVVVWVGKDFLPTG